MIDHNLKTTGFFKYTIKGIMTKGQVNYKNYYFINLKKKK